MSGMNIGIPIPKAPELPKQPKPGTPAYNPIPFAGDPSQPKIGGFSTSTLVDAGKLADWFKNGRQGDIKEGTDFFSKYFGAANPEMAGVLTALHNRAMGGLTMPEMQALRDRGTAGINQQTATNLHQLRGVLGASGVRGGAAGGAALPVLNTAAQQRTKLEGDIANADLQMRQGALKDYYSALTGERGGLLGSIFGYAGLGAGDRTNGLSGVLSDKFIGGLGDYLGKITTPNPAAAGAGVQGVAGNLAGGISGAINGGGGNIPFSLPGLPGLAGVGDNIGKVLSFGSPYGG